MEKPLPPPGGLSPTFFAWLSNEKPFSVNELRRQLGYGNISSSRVTVFSHATESLTAAFVIGGGVPAPGLLNWAEAQDQGGLIRLTCRFLDEDKAGATFWPDDPGHINYGMLQYSTDSSVIQKLMIQLFFNLILESCNPAQKNSTRPTKRAPAKPPARNLKKRSKIDSFPVTVGLETGSLTHSGEEIQGRPLIAPVNKPGLCSSVTESQLKTHPVPRNVVTPVNGNGHKMIAPRPSPGNFQLIDHSVRNPLQRRATVDFSANFNLVNGQTTSRAPHTFATRPTDKVPLTPGRPLLPAPPTSPGPDGHVNPFPRPSQLTRRATFNGFDHLSAAHETCTVVPPRSSMNALPLNGPLRVCHPAATPQANHSSKPSVRRPRKPLPTGTPVEPSNNATSVDKPARRKAAPPRARKRKAEGEILPARAPRKKQTRAHRPLKTEYTDAQFIIEHPPGSTSNNEALATQCPNTSAPVVLPGPPVIPPATPVLSLPTSDQDDAPPSLIHSVVASPDEPVAQVLPKQNPVADEQLPTSVPLFDGVKKRPQPITLPFPQKGFVRNPKLMSPRPVRSVLQVKTEPDDSMTPSTAGAPPSTPCIPRSFPIPSGNQPWSALTPCPDTPMLDCPPTPSTPASGLFNTKFSWGMSSMPSAAMTMHVGTPGRNLPMLPTPPMFANTLAQQNLQSYYGFNPQGGANDYFGNNYALARLDQLSPCSSVGPSPSVNTASYGQSIGRQIENTALMFVGGFGSSTTEIWDQLDDTPEMKALALFTPQQDSCMPGSMGPAKDFFN